MRKFCCFGCQKQLKCQGVAEKDHNNKKRIDKNIENKEHKENTEHKKSKKNKRKKKKKKKEEKEQEEERPSANTNQHPETVSATTETMHKIHLKRSVLMVNSPKIIATTL